MGEDPQAPETLAEIMGYGHFAQGSEAEARAKLDRLGQERAGRAVSDEGSPVRNARLAGVSREAGDGTRTRDPQLGRLTL
jgi:hypothetical protein